MVTILDGGMGRELKRSGAPFRQPEWSALALIEAPETVEAVHRAYCAAGAEVITTNSYALVPFHIGAERFASEGLKLAARAGQVARTATNATPGVRVAGSLPPVCGSYRPDLFDPAVAAPLLAVLIKGMAPHVDLWLAETLSALDEARAVMAQLRGIRVRCGFRSRLLTDRESAQRPASCALAKVSRRQCKWPRWPGRRRCCSIAASQR